MAFQPVFIPYANPTPKEPGLILPHEQLFFAMTDSPFLICAEDTVARQSLTLAKGKKLPVQRLTPDDLLTAMCDPTLRLVVQRRNSEALEVFRTNAGKIGGEAVSVGANAVAAIQSVIAAYYEKGDMFYPVTVESLVRGLTKPGPMVHGMAVRHYVPTGT